MKVGLYTTQDRKLSQCLGIRMHSGFSLPSSSQSSGSSPAKTLVDSCCFIPLLLWKYHKEASKLEQRARVKPTPGIRFLLKSEWFPQTSQALRCRQLWKKRDRECLSLGLYKGWFSAQILKARVSQSFPGSTWLRMQARHSACEVAKGRQMMVCLLHLRFWPTSLAHLHVTKGNMCYAPGFLSLNKALSNLAQIDLCEYT